MSLLQNPAWTALGVIATIIVGFIGVYVTLWARSRKALSYEVVSDIPIVAIRRERNNAVDAVAEGIEIRYKGNMVNDVRVVAVRLWNAGNVPIVASDYMKPIRFAFGGQLLGYTVLETKPAEIQNDIIAGAGSGPDHAEIQLREVLFNPEDSVTLQAVLTNFTGSVSAQTRIIGVSEIHRLSRSRFSRGQFAKGMAIVGAGILVSIGAFLSPAIVNAVIGLVGGLLIGAGAIYLWPYLKAWWSKRVW